MLIGRGPRAQTEDFVDFLLECHERIRRFSELACRLAEQHDPPAAEVKDAAAKVHRYFSEALPLHVRDEEESLLPHLQPLGGEVALALERMSREHGAHAQDLAALRALCKALVDRPDELSVMRAQLSDVAGRLRREFAEHLASEERWLFPAVRSALPQELQRQLLQELRERRASISRQRPE